MFVTSSMRDALAWQIMQSINILKDGFDDEGAPTNCCPICCGACSKLLKVFNEPWLLEELNEILSQCPYVTEGNWSFWNDKKERLRVNKVKKLWFKKDGSHKAICVSSNGIDQSEQLHRTLGEAEIGFDPKRLKRRYVER